MGERRERLAVAIADIDRMPADVRKKLLKDKLDLENVIRHAGQLRQEEVPSVMFTCSLLTAAKICDIMRSNDRAVKDEPTRVYLKKELTWARVPLDKSLTITIGHDVMLNPAVFAPDAPPTALKVPPTKFLRPTRKEA